MAAAVAVALESREHAIGILDARLGGARARASPGRHCDVLGDGELAEHLAFFRGEADAHARDPIWPKPGDVLAVEFDRAGRGLKKAHDSAETRGLAGAVAADQADELAGIDLE